MAAVVMVVSSHHRHGRPPKLAPKPPSLTGQLAKSQSMRYPVPILPSPLSLDESSAPKLYGAKEKESCDTRDDRVSHSWPRCVNQTASCEECRNAPVNIGSTTAVVLRSGRKSKAPKPLPYLEPIVTYLSRDAPHPPAVDGRSSGDQQRRRKRVTFAPSSARAHRSRRHRVARAHSEKLTRGRRRELAYLVVDLESGTISSPSEMCEPKREPLRGASLQRSLTLSDSLPSRGRLLSTTAADGKPVPLPRRKRAENDFVTPEPPSSDGRENSTSPTPPPRSPAGKPIPEREEDDATSPSGGPHSSSTKSRSATLVHQRRHVFEPQGSPQDTPGTTVSDAPTPPAHKPCVKSNSDPQPKPAASVAESSPPPPGVPPRSTQPLPHVSKNPPPLPAKSELSRKIQHSIKQKKALPPPVPQPYEAATPLKLQEDNFDTQQNNSYGAHTADDGGGDYEISDPEQADRSPSMEDDKPEAMYIDPTQSKQFSSTGKPRPPRPPPPTSSAIRNAQQKKAQVAVSAAIKNTKRLTKQRSNPNIHSMSTGLLQKTKSHLRVHPSSSSRSKSPVDDEQCYEELDVGSPPVGSPILWRPPSALNPSQSLVLPARAETAVVAEPVPSLPPRLLKPPSNTAHHTIDRGNKLTPSGITQSKSSGDLQDPRGSRQVSPNPSKGDSNAQDPEPEYDEDNVYEPVDTSAPIAPRRRKKNVKGTLVTSPQRTQGNIYKQNETPSGTKSSPVPRRSAPPPPLHGKRSGKGTDRSPKTAKSLSDKGKADRKDLPGKLSTLILEDEGGVEEYVDMDYRSVATEEEDGPELYVDMQPTNKIEEENEELSTSLRPYLRT